MTKCRITRRCIRKLCLNLIIRVYLFSPIFYTNFLHQIVLHQFFAQVVFAQNCFLNFKIWCKNPELRWGLTGSMVGHYSGGPDLLLKKSKILNQDFVKRRNLCLKSKKKINRNFVRNRKFCLDRKLLIQNFVQHWNFCLKSKKKI